MPTLFVRFLGTDLERFYNGIRTDLLWYGSKFEDYHKKMRKVIILFCVLSFFLFISCVRGSDGYRITEIHLQRIEFDDSTFNDRIIYALSVECEVTRGLVPWGVPSTGFTENGCYDSIKDVVIEDSGANIITDSLTLFTFEDFPPDIKIVQKEGVNQIDPYRTYDDWRQILRHLQNARPFEIESGILLYTNEDVPQPTSVTIKFSDHEIKARVNNTPVKYSIIKRE